MRILIFAGQSNVCNLPHPQKPLNHWLFFLGLVPHLELYTFGAYSPVYPCQTSDFRPHRGRASSLSHPAVVIVVAPAILPLDAKSTAQHGGLNADTMILSEGPVRELTHRVC